MSDQCKMSVKLSLEVTEVLPLVSTKDCEYDGSYKLLETFENIRHLLFLTESEKFASCEVNIM